MAQKESQRSLLFLSAKINEGKKMSEPKYLLNSDGKESGPFTASELRALARKGQITTESLIRRGNGVWVPASSIKNLFKNESQPGKSATNSKKNTVVPPPLPNQPIHGGNHQDQPTRTVMTMEEDEDFADEEKQSNKKPFKIIILASAAMTAFGAIGISFLVNQESPTTTAQKLPPPGTAKEAGASDQKKQSFPTPNQPSDKITPSPITANADFGGYSNFGTLYFSSRSEIWNATIVKLKLPLGTKLITGDEAETFAGVLAKNINSYLAKSGVPNVSIDRSAIDLIQRVSPASCRYKLHVGTANKITEADPFAGSTDIILDSKEITESPEAQKALHILIFDGTVISKNSASAQDIIFQVEGLDDQNKILSTGLLKPLENLIANSPAKCKFFLPMESPKSIDSLRSIRVAMYADPSFLAFEKDLKARIGSGDLVNLATTIEKMDRKWTWRAKEIVSENLASMSPAVRAASAYCLGITLDREKGSKEAFIKLFNDNDPVVREIIIKAASQMTLTESEGVDLAKLALADPAAPVQANGILLYSKHRDADAVQYLDSMLKLMGNAKPQVQSIIANELEKPGVIQPKNLSTLVSHLSSKSPELLSTACRLIGSLGQDGANGVPELTRVLENENPLVVSEAIKSLGKIGPKAAPAAKYLEGLCKSENMTVRKSALESLPRISRAASSISVLINALADTNQEIANHAIACLRSMDPPLGPSDLKAVIDKFENPSDPIRVQAYEVLSQVGKADSSLVPWALKGMEDHNHQINLLCIKYLTAQTNLDSETSKALAKIFDQYVIGRKDDHVKIKAMELFSKQGPKGDVYIPTIKKLLSANQDEAVTIAALNLASSIGGPAKTMVPDILALVKRPPNPAPPNLNGFRQAFLATGQNSLILKSLSSIGKDGLPGLIDGLNHPDLAIRLQSLLAIQSLGRDGKPALVPITPLTLNKNPIIRSQAQETYGILEKLK